MPPKLKILSTADRDFDSQFKLLLDRELQDEQQVSSVVREIVASVRSGGDASLLRYTNELDRRLESSVAELEVLDFEEALLDLDKSLKESLTTAADRIKSYHEKQKMSSWEFKDEMGNSLGQRVIPIERVGVYVPGGKASYPSSVLMNVIPAKVAGVSEIIMVVPAPDGFIEDVVLAAAAIAGVDKVFTIGGAQAVAALAFGTETIPRVDKIVGPGNIFVAKAKAMLFGEVGIDMIAGPSEILVICDGLTNPDWIAMDLFSQAEHDERSQAILVSTSVSFLSEVQASIERLLPNMSRKDVISASLSQNGAFISVDNMDEAIELVNRIAPEHLVLSVDNPRNYLSNIQHAGSIFLGRHTPEVFGDYCAGPNHVLPTSGTARFCSPLSVYDFQKRSSVLECSIDGASQLADLSFQLASSEGLDAHAMSAKYRASKK